MIAAAVADQPRTGPRSDSADLLDLALRVLEPVRILLSRFGAPMLTIATSATRVYVAPWAHDLIVRADLCDARAACRGVARELDEARRHGGAVCAVLARRWPVNATPPIIGVVSDGVGLAISGGHPCGLTPDWLIDHVAGRAPIDLILPFGTAAALLIQPAASVAGRH